MTPRSQPPLIVKILSEQASSLLPKWTALLKQNGILATGRIKETELATQCRTVLDLLATAIAAAGLDVAAAPYQPLRDLLADISRSRAIQGFSPSETASFVFSLKPPLFEAIDAAKGSDDATALRAVQDVTRLIDALGLHTMEVFQKSREEVIVRQQREIAELSTPVVKLWEGVLALPLIGTLDSQRTQIVMENLLESIVAERAEIAIIDITGVPTVDTLTAQHLLKTVSAARLMGADCIISGIRPQIAQTMVHLGVELNVVSKATLADAFAVALRRVGRTVAPLKTVHRQQPVG
ncbi:STAS domain-containing protein [Rhodoplanes serenus]|jgi:rsbT co-antagonist protein RsbR|uniref:STAS domain-containing protein n=1 Tax=Rhodoplanes serenus TaxID=200615 RepID=A0A327KEQ7_9BRAD|nr:STAS domain-containing protein [Rhodoplanes serenus]MTW18821.1 STAS domain-containing protein [Rhodoplanes serenus]RAI36566.1 anti-anti-sigma factor [Rhodoplanes serenus]